MLLTDSCVLYNRTEHSLGFFFQYSLNLKLDNFKKLQERKRGFNRRTKLVETNCVSVFNNLFRFLSLTKPVWLKRFKILEQDISGIIRFINWIKLLFSHDYLIFFNRQLKSGGSSDVVGCKYQVHLATWDLYRCKVEPLPVEIEYEITRC